MTLNSVLTMNISSNLNQYWSLTHVYGSPGSGPLVFGSTELACLFLLLSQLPGKLPGSAAVLHLPESLLLLTS